MINLITSFKWYCIKQGKKKYLSIAIIVMYKSQLKQTKQFLLKWLDFSKRRAPGMS